MSEDTERQALKDAHQQAIAQAEQDAMLADMNARNAMAAAFDDEGDLAAEFDDSFFSDTAVREPVVELERDDDDTVMAHLDTDSDSDFDIDPDAIASIIHGEDGEVIPDSAELLAASGVDIDAIDTELDDTTVARMDDAGNVVDVYGNIIRSASDIASDMNKDTSVVAGGDHRAPHPDTPTPTHDGPAESTGDTGSLAPDVATPSVAKPSDSHIAHTPEPMTTSTPGMSRSMSEIRTSSGNPVKSQFDATLHRLDSGGAFGTTGSRTDTSGGVHITAGYLAHDVTDDFLDDIFIKNGYGHTVTEKHAYDDTLEKLRVLERSLQLTQQELTRRDETVTQLRHEVAMLNKELATYHIVDQVRQECDARIVGDYLARERDIHARERNILERDHEEHEALIDVHVTNERIMRAVIRDEQRHQVRDALVDQIKNLQEQMLSLTSQVSNLYDGDEDDDDVFDDDDIMYDDINIDGINTEQSDSADGANNAASSDTIVQSSINKPLF